MSWLHWFDNTALVGFYALGLVAIIASLRVIMLANPVHAILSMIVTLLALAGIFFIIGAPFAGALQVIVYAGAILVLFVFVIMMLNLGTKNDARESKWLASDVWAVPTALTFVIAVVLVYMLSLGNGISTVEGTVASATIGATTVSAKQVGIALFTEYLLLVEVAALLLLAALVAAYHLGKKALDDENESHTSRLSAPRGHSDEVYDYQPIDAKDFIDTHNKSNVRSNLHNKEDS
ncbi:NADH-quinone oxidoreductase subunit J [Psychrobacter phenylpyruvicus]|uniref:NADH-quinone oxidoreductase subunit J n=1 Tax=Psychrobacter phenylpyruvicus TaxID=29432 RepID=A0A379LIQ8_9GAMM|nr:NADH-quinone oxidoreductase subunit J [Psychrobacter phenylpyruvicus]SUD90321.1 NADH-quinone oxidoreductase subunit J [Psychrobacter phenylpyruvicus]